MALMAGATTLGDLAGAIGMRAQQSAIVAELKAGSEDAYAWLIGEFHQPIYSLVHRIVADPADAADTTQEVFLKVFRGMNHFHGESSLKTWIYRIAVHEASNRRRWWFRHKAKETSIEPNQDDRGLGSAGMRDTLMDESESPFDMVVHEEIRERVEEELRQISEPYRTTVILRDLGRNVVRRDSRDHRCFPGNSEVTADPRPGGTAPASDGIRNGTWGTTRSASSRRGQRAPGRLRDFCDRGHTMTCTQAKPLFSPYLDGAVTGKQMRELNHHLEGCDHCSRHYSSLRRTQGLLARVGRRKAPPDLALKLRVAISQEAAQSRRRYLDGLRVRFDNALDLFMVPATARGRAGAGRARSRREQPGRGRAVVGRGAGDGVRAGPPGAPQGSGDLQHDGQRGGVQRLRRGPC